MKSIWEILRKNREECIEFLKRQKDERYVFVEYDEDESEWLNPNYEGEDKSCYVEESAPFVTYANDNGYVSEYIVTEMFLKERFGEKEMFVKVVNVQDYEDCFEIPVTYLYGASECYIYEMMMDLNLV